jgi:acyl-coenzyme A thioesterase PaaI-like protein
MKLTHAEGASMTALQDLWALHCQEEGRTENEYGACFGCGPENRSGLKIKSFWNGSQCRCRWMAAPEHCGVTGIMNGGLTATLIDCHSFWTALAATYQEEGRGFGEGAPFQFLTGSLQVRYLHPIPVGAELELRAHIAKSGSRSRVVACSVFVAQQECARAEVTVVRIK